MNEIYFLIVVMERTNYGQGFIELAFLILMLNYYLEILKKVYEN